MLKKEILKNKNLIIIFKIQNNITKLFYPPDAAFLLGRKIRENGKFIAVILKLMDEFNNQIIPDKLRMPNIAVDNLYPAQSNIKELINPVINIKLK